MLDGLEAVSIVFANIVCPSLARIGFELGIPFRSELIHRIA
jgi:hypothetical protein